jgi:hypothetical protein
LVQNTAYNEANDIVADKANSQGQKKRELFGWKVATSKVSGTLQAGIEETTLNAMVA